MAVRKYWVEAFRPPYTPGGSGLAYRVHSGDACVVESLHPNMTAVFEVTHCMGKRQALAAVIEAAAGMRTTAHLIMGGRQSVAS